ncbi:FAD-binding oxidoreductase [Pseudomonas sp. LS1212]|uniref:L-pipecolate oxidase n=1 Tax=Pseudomonas sp. LS1212 TaxID=2972478 RepID=UPI00215BBFEC|nr:FAD-binding oxidoreductase [Pseudomonas sp. LS1212]UVJ46238.1 FAD-binding oxidoreductase [Pseudomonas sp. LS1212]
MDQLREQCLWEHVTTRQVSPITLNGTVNVDVCVIGGGITGLSAALHLLEQGMSVALIEAAAIGTGGSGRNVGLVNAGSWIPPDDAEKTLGAGIGERFNTVMGRAPATVFALINKYGIDCQARNDGTLHMAHNAAGARDIESRHDQWKRRGADVELLTGAKCRDYCGTDKIPTALLDRRAGTINPMAYTVGLAQAVINSGGQIFQQSPVQTVQRNGAGWAVATAGGSVVAEKVVVSTGAYTEGEWAGIKQNYFKGYYYNVASAPLTSDAANEILKYGQGSWDTRLVLSSIRRDDQGRLILGSMGKMSNKPDWFIRSWADRIQGHYFPQLGKVEWQMHWTGCIDFTPDHLVKLFEPAPGIIAANGYNGRGNTTGTVMGKAFADFLAKGDTRALPVPFAPTAELKTAGVRALAYETGFNLYHAGQCLRVIL